MEIVTKEGTCTCHQHEKCVLGKIASQPRCTEKELRDAGYKTLDVLSKYQYWKEIGEIKGWGKGLGIGLVIAILTAIFFMLM